MLSHHYQSRFLIVAIVRTLDLEELCFNVAVVSSSKLIWRLLGVVTAVTSDVACWSRLYLQLGVGHRPVRACVFSLGGFFFGGWCDEWAPVTIAVVSRTWAALAQEFLYRSVAE